MLAIVDENGGSSEIGDELSIAICNAIASLCNKSDANRVTAGPDVAVLVAELLNIAGSSSCVAAVATCVSRITCGSNPSTTLCAENIDAFIGAEGLTSLVESCNEFMGDASTVEWVCRALVNLTIHEDFRPAVVDARSVFCVVRVGTVSRNSLSLAEGSIFCTLLWKFTRTPLPFKSGLAKRCATWR